MPADIDFTGGLEVLVVDDVPHHKYGWFDPNSMLSVWYGGDRAPTMHQGVFHGRGLRERLYTDKTVDISEDDEEFSVEMTRLTEADVDNFVLRYAFVLYNNTRHILNSLTTSGTRRHSRPSSKNRNVCWDCQRQWTFTYSAWLS